MTNASDTQVGGYHYRSMGDFQPWDVLRHWLTPDEYRGYQKGVAIAYLARERQKGGDQDIAKAGHHLQKLVEVLGEAAQAVVQPDIGGEAEKSTVVIEPCCGKFSTCAKPCVPRVNRYADKDGWIEWPGGECPVPEKTPVEVEYRHGGQSTGAALVDKDLTEAFWRVGIPQAGTPDETTWDIVRFRVISATSPTQGPAA